jgi:hypothetical protein
VQKIKAEDLKKMPHLNIEGLQGRTVNMMPVWENGEWHMWFATDAGLIKGKIVDLSCGDYLAHAPAQPTDLHIPFMHILWQHISWPSITPYIVAISDDIQNLGVSTAKMRFFFDHVSTMRGQTSTSFVTTELEYSVMLARSIFDLFQKLISIVWDQNVRLSDTELERTRKRIGSLPETFSKMVLADKKVLRTSEEIQAKYGLPPTLAKEYESAGHFFSQLRDIRDSLVHGTKPFGTVFETEKGFCVDPKSQPYSGLVEWKAFHYYNENIVSLTPWIAEVAVNTIQTCHRLVLSFATSIAQPPEIAPGYLVYTRGPQNLALMNLLDIKNGSDPWWTK